MYRKLLTKKFFDDNPYVELSAQRLAYTYLTYKGLEETATEIVSEHIGFSAARLAQIDSEKEMIAAENDVEKIFQMLRKKIDTANRPVLIDKALEYEDELLPKVIEKLIRNNHATFIENAIRMLAWSKIDYSATLFERYKEFRSPYVQSLVCLVLGFRGDEDTIPWMMDRFFEMKNMYPDENYAQGPLLALYELNDRFYSK